MAFGVSKLGAEIDVKTKKNRSPRWGASWQGFLMDFGWFWEASWLRKSSEPFKKTTRKLFKKATPSKIEFSSDVGGFLKGKRRQVGTIINQKSMPVAKSDFLKNLGLVRAVARCSRVWGVEVGSKNRASINRKTKSSWEGI